MLIPGTIQQEITELESIDMMLLRKVLSANSTTTSNADSWYNLTSQEITELESIDKMLLRKVLSAHSKTPLELLYLETGNVPIRLILKSRRPSFLHYLWNKEVDALGLVVMAWPYERFYA